MNAHPQYEEDFDLYELGVLDGSDQAEFTTHLASCAECRAKLESAQSRLALLALAAPNSEPPPAARERILARFRERGPRRREEAPGVRARGGFRTRVWAWSWAAACLVLLAVAAWLWRENLRLSQREAELIFTYKRIEDSNEHLRAESARAQAVLDVLTGPQTVQVELSPSAAHPMPHGKAFYNRARGLLFYTTNLNSLPPDRTYELWLIPTEGKPVDVGIFNTDTRGNGQVILPSLPQGLTAKAFAVTIEAAGGVPAPTGTMVLVGPVS